jgi:hypothetical protein
MIKASLDWINSQAHPQDEFSHPNDENRVKCASRALSKMKIDINEQEMQEIVDYCQQLRMPRASIGKITDWYSRPKNLRLKYGMKFTTRDLKTIWKNYFL